MTYLMPWTKEPSSNKRYTMHRKELGIPWSNKIELDKTGYFRYQMYIWDSDGSYIGVSCIIEIIAMTINGAMKKADKILDDEWGYELLSQERAEKLKLLL